MQTQSDLIYTIKILGYTHGILGNIIKNQKAKLNQKISIIVKFEESVKFSLYTH